MKAPDQSVVDANFAAKMEARRNKTAPVMVTAPTLPAENPNDPSAVDTRYRAKLAAHKKALEAPAIATAPAPAPSVETQAEATAPAATAAESGEPPKEKSESSFSQQHKRR
jgi:hypothetical protein